MGEQTLTTLPLDEGKSAEIREDLVQKLRECDALIVVYGEGPLAWVDNQLLHINRIAPEREQVLRALGVYNGPPEEKPKVLMRMPGLEILSCRKGLDVQRLQKFLAPLLEEAGK